MADVKLSKNGGVESCVFYRRDALFIDWDHMQETKTIPRCADCDCKGMYLCDYPVGNDLTCDRKMCNNHRLNVGEGIDYCLGHYKMYRDYQCKDKT